MGRCRLFAVSKITINSLSKNLTSNMKFHRFAKAGSATAWWEEQSWLPLSQLAENKPESGVHFQSITPLYVTFKTLTKVQESLVYNRKMEKRQPVSYLQRLVPVIPGSRTRFEI